MDTGQSAVVVKLFRLRLLRAAERKSLRERLGNLAAAA
jgi:hypothetical protein